MVILEIKVVPGAMSSKIISNELGIVTCYLKNQPEDGKANKELIEVLSDKLALPKACIQIVSGLTSRRKRIKIDRALTLESIYHRLGFEMQKPIKFT